MAEKVGCQQIRLQRDCGFHLGTLSDSLTYLLWGKPAATLWATLWRGPDGEELTCCQPCEWAGAWFFSPSRRLQPCQQLDPWKALNWNDSDKLLLGFLLLETVWDHLFYTAKFWSNIDNWYRADQWFIVCSSSTNISVNCLQIAVYNWWPIGKDHVAGKYWRRKQGVAEDEMVR